MLRDEYNNRGRQCRELGVAGNIPILGFPPIGIMSLSAVLKRAGHECVMFDPANPGTPNDVIIEGSADSGPRWWD